MGRTREVSTWVVSERSAHGTHTVMGSLDRSATHTHVYTSLSIVCTMYSTIT
jgi:hypothetical protein